MRGVPCSKRGLGGDVAVRPAGGQPEVKGQRGFGSAVQALLRYLSSMTTSLGSTGIVGSPADPPVNLLGPPLTLEGMAARLILHDIAAQSDAAKFRHIAMACMEVLSAYDYPICLLLLYWSALTLSSCRDC